MIKLKITKYLPYYKLCLINYRMLGAADHPAGRRTVNAETGIGIYFGAAGFGNPGAGNDKGFYNQVAAQYFLQVIPIE